jgi:Inhibitor of vertebrate lysozyme (Ivy)
MTVFRALLVSLLLLTSVPALAAGEPKGPLLGDLMKQPTYRAAWDSMLAGETVPDWINDYAKTFDGPPIPSIDMAVGSTSYELGFTCKPNACGTNQLYVLFTKGGARAWGLLLTDKDRRWLGYPDKDIQAAILSRVE